MTSRAEVDALLDAAGRAYVAGRLDEAAAAYGRAERLAPADLRAAYSLAVIDIRRGRFAAARPRLTAFVARHPDHFAAWHNLGMASQALGRWRAAADAYGKALALRPDAAETGFALAVVLATEGRIDEAAGLYRRLAQDPAAAARALTRLAMLRPREVSDGEVEQLRTAAAGGEAAIGPLFALGEVLEARGDFAAAFERFAAGAALKRQVLEAGDSASRPAAVEAEHERSVATVRRLFTADFLSRHAGGGQAEAAPIFIVGFPRCGSSLVEQILASHPGVQGMGESGELARVVDGRFPYGPQAAGPDHFRQLADDYLAALRRRGWKRGRRPVDKTLENHLHVGMIALMFPRAVILDCRRDPVETGLACYRQLFASGNETLYDLGQIGREYRRYGAVMDHWARVAPGAVTPVSYEALVDAPQDAIAWLVTQACGLDWSPRCLRFHQTRRPVATASAAQVRQPIYRSSLERRSRYEQHLAPLIAALGPDAGG